MRVHGELVRVEDFLPAMDRARVGGRTKKRGTSAIVPSSASNETRVRGRIDGNGTGRAGTRSRSARPPRARRVRSHRARDAPQARFLARYDAVAAVVLPVLRDVRGERRAVRGGRRGVVASVRGGDPRGPRGGERSENRDDRAEVEERVREGERTEHDRSSTREALREYRASAPRAVFCPRHDHLVLQR